MAIGSHVPGKWVDIGFTPKNVGEKKWLKQINVRIYYMNKIGITFVDSFIVFMQKKLNMF